MKKLLFIALVVTVLVSCSPVLNRDLMKKGVRETPFSLMKADPGAYKGKLYILGGIIVDARFTEAGSQIEALAVPVDSLGYLKDTELSAGRFLAVYPRASGLLDPMVYKKGREITMAGAFVEIRNGKIDEMEYSYPVFEISQIYLWKEQRNYYPYPYYYDPFYYRSPFLFDPWGRPYPSPFWPPQPW